MIKAKLVSNQSVTTIDLSDDPSDQELLDALGSEGGLVSCAIVRDWEALRGSDTGVRTLVVGSAPSHGNTHPVRKSCDLTDKEASELVRGIETILPGMKPK